jgi:hypothetical protein
MTVSSEAKRTLVKSPPELWSELSDPESLARHLDGLEQIRITRVEPETAVEWEADGASGRVRLQPSGFGTKVTLSLSRELPPAEPVGAESEPAGEPTPELGTDDEHEADAELVAEATLEPPASEPAVIAQSEIEPTETVSDEADLDPQPIATESDAIATEPDPVESEPTPESSDPIPVVETSRQGFFARLFKRPRKSIASADQSIDAPREPEPAALVEPESEPMPVIEPEPAEVTVEIEQIVPLESEPVPEPVHSPARSVTADLATLEAEIAEQDEAMLTAMLDRLGAAHHRPFSRS